MAGQHSTHSTLRERVVEHVFVGEALRTLWRWKVVDVEVLRSEFDAHGYDLVMARRRVVRHIQFKTGTSARPGDVSVSLSLAAKPSGCVIWIKVSETLEMAPYFWFGNLPGKPLPSLGAFPIPLRPTHNKKGERPPRVNHRLVSGKVFEKMDGLEDLLVRLLGEFRYDVTLGKPAVFSKADLDRMAAIVRAGGAVQRDVGPMLEDAGAVAIATCQREVVGVGAIKPPRPVYASEIAAKSRTELASDALELGYVAVTPGHQDGGLATRIVAALVERSPGPLFATTDDVRMKRVLGTAGFEQVGQEWGGQRGQLSLWLRKQ